jgi:mannan endo-1,4-beta-mannosidase
VNKTHLSIPEVDIFSDHFYPLNAAKLEADIALVGSAKKVCWTGLNGQKTPQGDTLASFYKAIESHQASSQPIIAGDLFWSLFMYNVPDCYVSVLNCCYFLETVGLS